jgi:hypothetical protein
MQFNGSAVPIPNGIQLTKLAEKDSAGSAFFTDKKPYSAFTVEFDYVAENPNGGLSADGFTFTLQNSDDGASSLGREGGSLGYEFTITNSVCIYLSFFFLERLGYGLNGNLDVINDPVGNIQLVNKIMHIKISYDTDTLTTTISQDGADDFTSSRQLDLINILGGDGFAFVGFTGSTGGFTATQKITNFIFRSQIPCLHEDSLVSIPSVNTNNHNHVQIPINTLKAGDYVIDYHNKPVKLFHNVRFGLATSFVKIAKNSLGSNLPSQDLLIRKEHPILINGKEVRADSLLYRSKASLVKVKSSPVFSLCTKERTFVLMQGIPVCTWAYDDLMLQKDKYNFKLL